MSFISIFLFSQGISATNLLSGSEPDTCCGSDLHTTWLHFVCPFMEMMFYLLTPIMLCSAIKHPNRIPIPTRNNLYKITTLILGNSPAFTVLDGLQHPVLLCFLPRHCQVGIEPTQKISLFCPSNRIWQIVHFMSARTLQCFTSNYQKQQRYSDESEIELFGQTHRHLWRAFIQHSASGLRRNTCQNDTNSHYWIWTNVSSSQSAMPYRTWPSGFMLFVFTVIAFLNLKIFFLGYFWLNYPWIVVFDVCIYILLKRGFLILRIFWGLSWRF